MASKMHMNAGDGKTSYARNQAFNGGSMEFTTEWSSYSKFYRTVISKTQPLLDEILEDMFGGKTHVGLNTNCYRIVDFGCSSGPNSIWVMSHIVSKIRELCHRIKLEFEVFLNDLPDNDFNNLFKFLKNKNGSVGQGFWYGVPGSFYGRLFARKTLHFAYSAYSLHWLSQVPKEVESNNGENICLATTSSPRVLEAYAKQFYVDFSTFLRSRGEEIIEGGRMQLIFIGRSVEDPSCYDDCAQFTFLAKSLQDLVIEGIVWQDDLYSFNLPFYSPCKQEVETIIKKEGSFILDNIHDFRIPWDANNDVDHDEQANQLALDKHKTGKIVADCHRALLEPMMSSHFGSSIIDELFQRYARNVADHLSTNKLINLTLVLSLTR